MVTEALQRASEVQHSVASASVVEKVKVFTDKLAARAATLRDRVDGQPTTEALSLADSGALSGGESASVLVLDEIAPVPRAPQQQQQQARPPPPTTHPPAPRTKWPRYVVPQSEAEIRAWLLYELEGYRGGAGVAASVIDKGYACAADLEALAKWDAFQIKELLQPTTMYHAMLLRELLTELFPSTGQGSHGGGGE